MRIGRPPWNAPDQLCTEYLVSMMSLSALGRKYGVSPDTVRLALAARNVEIRPVSETLGRDVWTEEQLAQLRAMYEDEQLSIQQIQARTSRGFNSVRSTLKRLGVQLRPRSTKGRLTASEETRRKISDSKKGKKGYERTPEQKARLREANLGRKHTPATLEKMSHTRIERGLAKGARNPMANEESLKRWIASNNLKPNRVEIQLEQVLETVCPGLFKINVLGDILILGGKIPDFVDACNHRIVELYGDYWHAGEDESERVRYFNQLGYKTLIVWEKELKDIEELKLKIKRFL